MADRREPVRMHFEAEHFVAGMKVSAAIGDQNIGHWTLDEPDWTDPD